MNTDKKLELLQQAYKEAWMRELMACGALERVMSEIAMKKEQQLLKFVKDGRLDVPDNAQLAYVNVHVDNGRWNRTPQMEVSMFFIRKPESIPTKGLTAAEKKNIKRYTELCDGIIDNMTSNHNKRIWNEIVKIHHETRYLKNRICLGHNSYWKWEGDELMDESLLTLGIRFADEESFFEGEWLSIID